MQKWIKYLIGLLVVVVAVESVCLCHRPRTQATQNVIKTDTTYRTVIINKPTATSNTIDRIERVRVPVILAMTDSVVVEVPVVVKNYEGDNYTAEVSGPTIGGLSPSLDVLSITCPTITTTRTVYRNPIANIGVGVGVQFNPFTRRFDFGVQVGVYFNVKTIWR